MWYRLGGKVSDLTISTEAMMVGKVTFGAGWRLRINNYK